MIKGELQFQNQRTEEVIQNKPCIFYDHIAWYDRYILFEEINIKRGSYDNKQNSNRKERNKTELYKTSKRLGLIIVYPISGLLPYVQSGNCCQKDWSNYSELVHADFMASSFHLHFSL